MHILYHTLDLKIFFCWFLLIINLSFNYPTSSTLFLIFFFIFSLQVTEEDLKYTIHNALLEDSIKIFQLLGGVEGVNDDVKLQFLQLLCFYNEKEPDSMEWLEERWFAASTRERHAATWKYVAFIG